MVMATQIDILLQNAIILMEVKIQVMLCLFISELTFKWLRVMSILTAVISRTNLKINNYVII